MRRTSLIVLFGLGLLAGASALFGSSMAFKLNIQFLVSGASASGTNTLALPWNRQVGVDDVFDLIQDINATGSPTNQVERIERWLPCSSATMIYQGATTDPLAVELEKGVGYWIKVTNTTDYVAVGTHDPQHVHRLFGSGCGGNGTNFFAPPYHSVAADGFGLIQDVDAHGVPPNSVDRLEYWVVGTNSRLVYSGAVTDPGAPPFVPGEALFVKVGVADTLYTPTHY